MSEEIQTVENNKPNINNPHDKGYKYLLSSEKVFLELLQSFVNLSWVSQIDPEAMTRIDNPISCKTLTRKKQMSVMFLFNTQTRHYTRLPG